MTNLTVQNYNNSLVIDSRLIAEELGIQHKSFKDLIRTYLVDFEEFGNLAATSVGVSGTTGYAEFYYLNEDQTYLSLTYSKNSPQVRAAKINLVKAFKKARENTKTFNLPKTYREALLALAAAEEEKENLIEENVELLEFKNETSQYEKFVELLDITKHEVEEDSYSSGVTVFDYLIEWNNNPFNFDVHVDAEDWHTISKRASQYFRLLEGRHPEKNNKNRNIFKGKKVAYIIATIKLVKSGV